MSAGTSMLSLSHTDIIQNEDYVGRPKFDTRQSTILKGSQWPITSMSASELGLYAQGVAR